MGSSSKPAKTSDRPIISSPHKEGGGTGSGGATGGAQEDMNRVCILSFSVKLGKSPLLRRGLALSIGDKGEVVLPNGTIVGRLGAAQYRMVVRCQEEGYKYRGKVGEKKDKTLYAQFG